MTLETLCAWWKADVLINMPDFLEGSFPLSFRLPGSVRQLCPIQSQHNGRRDSLLIFSIFPLFYLWSQVCDEPRTAFDFSKTQDENASPLKKRSVKDIHPLFHCFIKILLLESLRLLKRRYSLLVWFYLPECVWRQKRISLMSSQTTIKGLCYLVPEMRTKKIQGV